MVVEGVEMMARPRRDWCRLSTVILQKEQTTEHKSSMSGLGQGPPWRDLSARGYCHCNTLEAKPTELRPCNSARPGAMESNQPSKSKVLCVAISLLSL